jgi:hypothetical protein
MNHGCVSCFAKKMCKKETAKIKEVESVPETIETISDEKLIKTVPYVSVSKVHRALSKKGVNLGALIQFKDASGRNRELSRKSLHIAAHLQSAGEQIDKNTTFVQLYNMVQTHNLLEENS